MTEKSAPFEGVEKIYGTSNMTKLTDAQVLIIGIGGVGSWSAEALARSGVGNITLVDMDDICVSNTNRQIHATTKTIGQFKVDVMAQRIKTINPNCNIVSIDDFYTVSTSERILSKKYDYVIDAIDSVKSKAHLIDTCLRKSIPIIVAGASGGRKDPTKILIDDLSRSYRDRLLAAVRMKLRKEYNRKFDKKKKAKVKCIFSSEELSFSKDCSVQGQKLNCQSGYGSLMHITSHFGILAASIVINDLTKDD